MEGTYLFFRSSNHDAWETNDLFPTDGRIADFSLALYDCLSACQSKGRNSAASGTSVSLRLPINVNATVSISYLLSLLNSFRLHIIRHLALIDNYYFLCPITKTDVSLASLFPRVIYLKSLRSPQLKPAATQIRLSNDNVDGKNCQIRIALGKGRTEQQPGRVEHAGS